MQESSNLLVMEPECCGEYVGESLGFSTTLDALSDRQTSRSRRLGRSGDICGAVSSTPNTQLIRWDKCLKQSGSARYAFPFQKSMNQIRLAR